MPKQSLVAVAAALVLASCAAPPVVRWKRENPAIAAASMEGAMRHLEAARGTYREAVIDQMERESGVSSAVIGAGALVTLLAAGKAGSDAILGAAAIGGTTYAVGSLNLRRQRVQIYQAGVDALDCAQQAATPFNVPDAELKELTDRLVTLENARTTLVNVIVEATAIRRLLNAGSSDAPLLDATLATAANTRQAANNVIDAGWQFAGSVTGAAGQLVATVDRIDSAVTRSLIEATPDISTIKNQVGGIPEMIVLLTPSLQTRADAGMDRISAAAARAAGAGTPAEQVNQKLAAAIQNATNATDSVNSRLKTRVITGKPEAALKACGVAKVITDLATDKATLSFSAGVAGVGYIEVRGGLPPYDSEFEGTLVDGVTEKLPANSKRVQVSVSNKVTGTHQMSLRISDASQPRKVMNIAVAITAVDAPAPARAASVPEPAISAPKPAASSAATNAVATINAKSPFQHDGKAFGVQGVQVSGTVLTVALQCPAGSTSKYPQKNLANSLRAQASFSSAFTLRFTGDCAAAG